MYNNSKVAKAIRLAMMFGAAAAISAPTFAAAADEGAEEIEKIQVTGSRIKRTDMESPVPVTVIGRSDILAMGALNVADVLNSNPVAIAGSSQSNSGFSTSGVGLSTTELRGLGESRTLVLVNGRRFVSGRSPSAGYAVDLNAIPTSMIERIEILKSASSAIYGSDAVAGVVNIITRSDFEGVEVNAQTGISSESDRKKASLSITAGNTWDSGSASIAIGYDDDEGLKSSDRSFSEFDEAIQIDENGNEIRGRVNSSYPPQGRVGGYNADGTPFQGSLVDGFNRASYRQLVTPLERKYVAFNIRQNISDSVQFFAEANWNNAATNGSTIEPTPFNTNDVFLPARGGTGGISMTNPMVPGLLYDKLIADGLTDADNIPAMVRRMVEFGARSTDLERDTIRVVQGLDWEIDDNWMFNTYLSWGKTDQSQDNGGQINIERAALAFDVEVNARGELQCADELARIQGCVPLNLFSAGSITDAAVDYVKSPAKTSGQAEQFVFAASVTGELPLELPGGNIATAFGLEHRLEKGVYNPGDLAQTGSSSTNKAAPTDGKFSTDDIFAEAILPILDNLELDLAARYSDHSITGGDTTWNVGVEYSPFDSLMLRGSAATAIRTPNIADLYGGRGETFAGVSDPCSGITATDTSQAAINCLSIPEVAARVNADGSFELTQVEAQSTGGTVGGSDQVKAETADTYSFGFVWQVVDGLSMTLDYYDVSISDAISTTSRTTVLNRCFDVPAGEFDPSCGGNAVRDFKGALTEVDSGTSNENNIETSGLDLEVSYSVEMGPGTFTADLLWNHTNEYNVISIEDGTSVDYAGEVLSPEDRANLNLAYRMDDWSFAWRMRYWGESVDSVEEANFNFSTFAALEDSNNFDAVLYHDISATYYISDNAEVNVGIRNLFDEEPQFAGQGFNNGATGVNTVPEAFDVTGQYLNASVTVRF
jgi:outer membrane receptor protein involved in Fe transport